TQTALPSFSISQPAAVRYLPPFPTRRSSDLGTADPLRPRGPQDFTGLHTSIVRPLRLDPRRGIDLGVGLMTHAPRFRLTLPEQEDRKSTRLNSSHVKISYAVFCLKKKKKYIH